MKIKLSLLASFLVVGSYAFAQMETFVSYTGASSVFSCLNKIDLKTNHVLRCEAELANNRFFKCSQYPVPFVEDPGERLRTNKFALVRGESFCSRIRIDIDNSWEIISYISGKDIPESIRCPDSYRQAEDILHVIYENRYGFNEAESKYILFDPKRKKQLNIVTQHEFDCTDLPYRRDLDVARRAFDSKVRHRLREVVEAGVARRSWPESLSGNLVVSLDTDYGYILKTISLSSGPDILTGKRPTTEGVWTSRQVFTNVVASVSRIDGKWKVLGLIYPWSRGGSSTIVLYDKEGRMMFDAEYQDAPNQDGAATYYSFYDHDGHEIAHEDPRGPDEPEGHEKVYRIEDGVMVRIKDHEEVRRLHYDYESVRTAIYQAFSWSGRFNLKRLRERIAADAARIEAEKAKP